MDSNVQFLLFFVFIKKPTYKLDLLHFVNLESVWLRSCATNRKVVGSIPDGVIGIFH